MEAIERTMKTDCGYTVLKVGHAILQASGLVLMR